LKFKAKMASTTLIMMDAIQEKLEDLRIEKGLSLQELSEQTGISIAAVLPSSSLSCYKQKSLIKTTPRQ
jgi:hypothetical protein